MRDDECLGITLRVAILGVFVGMGLMSLLIYTTTPREVSEDEVVNAGHAEYYLDDNNERRWRWIECETCTNQENQGGSNPK